MSANGRDTERNPVEVLAEEFAERQRKGEQPTIAEYATRHPELADQIEAIFPTVALMVQLGERHHLSAHVARPWPAMPRLDLQQLGDFRVLREVGRGGMGVVFEAEQQSLGRRVALKVLPFGVADDERRRQRFEREARAAARLHHTNIVPVFGIGRQDGLCYYVMQFIEGVALDRWLRENEPQKRATAEYFRQVAEIGIQAAQALHYAHQQGILHRDIKPANLLVDKHGTVWITDFGVARVGQEEGLTRTGDFVGTLRYMAPEQIHGEPDARSDVYSLGITLYELLAGRPAYPDTSHLGLVQRIDKEDPVPLRRLQPHTPRDLETIVAKAIARDPGHRYANAGELAEDLRRFLEDRPIQAKRVSVAARLWRWCRRNRTVAALSALTAAAVLAAMLVGWVAYLNTQQALRQTEEAVVRAEGNLELSLDALESVFRQTAGRDRLRLPIHDPEMEPFATSVPSEENAALLERLLGFYERFAEYNEGNSRLLAETAKAYRRVGEIQIQLGQADKAEGALRRSMSLYHALMSDPLQKQRYAHELAAVYNDLGETPQNLARPREVRRELFEKALAVLGEDRSEAACLQRIRALNSLGRTVPSSGRWFWSAAPTSRRRQSPKTDAAAQEAERYHRAALSLAEEMVARDKANADYRFLLAQTHRYLSQRLVLSGRMEDAASENEIAVKLLEQLTADFPSVAQYKAELAEAYAMFVAATGPRSKSSGTKERLAKARTLADDLVAQHPRVPDFVALSARLRAREGMLEAWAGNRSEAIEAYRQAIGSFQKLADQYPAVPSFPYLRAVHQHVLGEYLRTIKQYEQARTELEKSAAGIESLLRTKPDVPPAVSTHLHRVYQTLSRTLDDLGDHESAAKIREKSRAKRPSTQPTGGQDAMSSQTPSMDGATQ